MVAIGGVQCVGESSIYIYIYKGFWWSGLSLCL